MNFKNLFMLSVFALALPYVALGRVISTATKFNLKGNFAISINNAFSNDSSKVLTIDANHVYVWNTADGKLLDTLKNDFHVSQASFSPNDKKIIVYGLTSFKFASPRQEVVVLWDVSHLAQ